MAPGSSSSAVVLGLEGKGWWAMVQKHRFRLPQAHVPVRLQFHEIFIIAEEGCKLQHLKCTAGYRGYMGYSQVDVLVGFCQLNTI